jgi:hypothetical protein
MPLQACCPKCGEELGELRAKIVGEPSGPEPDQASAKGQAIAGLRTLLAAAKHVQTREPSVDSFVASHQAGRVEGIETAIEVLRGKLDPEAEHFGDRKRGQRAPAGVTIKKHDRALPQFLNEGREKRHSEMNEDSCSSGSPLSDYARGLLGVIARRSPRETTSLQLAVLAARSIKSSDFGKGCKELVDGGLIDKVGPRVFRCSVRGLGIAGPQPPDPSGDALLMVWNAYLEKNEAKILTAIVDAKGVAMPDEIASDSGYSPTSSSFQGAIKKLRTLGLIEGSNRRGYTPCPELESRAGQVTRSAM